MIWFRQAGHWSLLLVTCVLALLSGCATAPTEYHEPPLLGVAERSAHNLSVLRRTEELVSKKYFDPKFRGVDWPAMCVRHEAEIAAAADEEALFLALNRLCAELKESHLNAIPPRRAHEYSTEHRASAGFRWEPVDGQRVVADIIPGSPAAAAGVQPGWLVLSRDGKPLPEKDPYYPRLGQTVTYGFLDEQDQPRTITMEPQLVNFERMDMRDLPEGILYLRFDVFSYRSLHWLSEQLKAHARSSAVVVDLRNNHGGNLLALDVALAEFFPEMIAAGHLIKRSGSVRENLSFPWLSAHYPGRVAILTDHFTASAAEIFSHVMQQHRRAMIIGRRTAGAVIVSRDFPLPGGGRLQVPVTDYIGNDGQRLEGRGVAPDLLRPALTLAERRGHLDPDLAAAVRALQQPAPTAPATGPFKSLTW